ncbi:unnamed protein product [Lasius platythorax]|uniref:Uncharacterized protein n=1 Tax=Lasius platythorax TaxID=488582 RepID=A0AAV2NN73_9HYME
MGWREGRINPIALSYFRPLRNRGGKVAGCAPSDKRLARSRRHHPSVAFTREKYQGAIHAPVNRHRGTGTFLSVAASCARRKYVEEIKRDSG